MKTLPVALATLCIGFAIGWIAKPVPGSPRKSAVTSPARANTSAPAIASEDTSSRATKVDRDRASTDKPDAPSNGQNDAGKRMMEKMQTAMLDRQRRKFEQHIDLLAEKLNLTPQQKADLLAKLEDRMKSLSGLMDGPMDMNPDEAKQADILKLASTSDIEEQLLPSLTPDQKVALDDFKAREHTRKVDAAALKSLSKFQGMFELDQSQQDQLFQVLTQDAESRISNESTTARLSGMFTEDMGMDMDPYDLGLQGALSDSMIQNAGSGKMDQKEAMKKFREVVEQRIEEKVELVRPVLNDQQLERYRTELKDKGMGVYGQMFMGMED